MRKFSDTCEEAFSDNPERKHYQNEYHNPIQFNGYTVKRIRRIDAALAEAAQVPDKGNVAADPLFRREYHIGPDSPCCNTGMTLGWEKGGKDLDGNPRLYRKRVDMGCYECQIGGFSLIVR